MSEWFTTFFDALAFDVWAALVPPSHSDAEARFLVDVLDLRPGSRVLDIPCGDGRLALRLARRGIVVDAIDLSAAATTRLEAAASSEQLPITVATADLRDPDHWPPTGRGGVSAACCAGNSFGYLGDRDTSTFLAGLASRLEGGGRLAIDVPVVAESMLPEMDAHDEHRVGDVELVMDHSYDVRRSVQRTSMTLRRGDEVAHRYVEHHIRTSGHVVALVEEAGFDVTDLLGGVDGSPFEVGSPTCWLLARRRP